MNSRVLALPEAGLATWPVPVAKKIRLRGSERFTLVFGCPQHKIPGGIKVFSLGTFAQGEQPSVEKVLRFSSAKVDFDGLFVRCTVLRIDACEVDEEGYCKVFVGCAVAAEGEGFRRCLDHRYEGFVQEALSHTWAEATFKRHDGRASLSLHNSCAAEVAATKLLFAIE